MNLGDNDCVLDAGCGAGRFIYRIRKTKSCQVYGVDTSRNMINRARKRVPDANYLIGDILHLPFRRKVFTAVICYSVLWHIPSERGGLFFNSDIYEKGLKEFKRVLEAGGRVLFNISNATHLQSIIDFFICVIWNKLLKHERLQTYKMPLRMAKSTLTKLGFKISDVVANGYYPVLLETLYIRFHPTLSENLINRYYDSFCRLENFVAAKSLLHAFAHTFVINAINNI